MPTKKFGDVYKRLDSPFWWIWYYDASGKRKYESTQTDDEDVAREILRSRITEFDQLRHGMKPVSDMPYKHFTEDFLKHYKARYPYETYKSHKSVVNEFTRYLESLSITRLSEITTAVINNYVTYLRNTKGSRANTCNNHLKNLHTQFSFAIKNGGLMKTNPAKDCEKVEVDDSIRKGALSAEEYQRFLDVTKKRHPFYCPIFYTFLHTGLRFTELISLQWEDIDWKAKVLWVMKPKGKKKPEPISIHDSLVRTLQALPKRSDYVFTDEDGNPFGARTRKIVRRLKDILKEANITSINTLHELRHTYCSQLFRVGLNSREVQRQMRHSELDVTEGYAHIFMPEYNKKIERLQRLDRKGKRTKPKRKPRKR